MSVTRRVREACGPLMYVLSSTATNVRSSTRALKAAMIRTLADRLSIPTTYQGRSRGIVRTSVRSSKTTMSSGSQVVCLRISARTVALTETGQNQTTRSIFDARRWASSMRHRLLPVPISAKSPPTREGSSFATASA